MPLFTTPDGRYLVAWETEGQGDGNSVIYDKWRAGENNGQPLPIWNRWEYEANLGSTPGPITPSPAPSGTDGPTPVPTPIPDPGSQGVPAPASVRVIQVTNESDGEISPRIDASRTRVFLAGSKAYVFAGHADGRPRFFSVDIQSGAVERLGPLVGFTGTGEDWYWGRDGWIYLLDGPRLRRVSPLAGGETQTVFDISDSHPGCDLWQPHSSDDGAVHSATVRRIVSSGKYPYIETLVVRNGREDPPFPAHGTLDESQITPDGGWIVIKETLEDGLSNRIINVVTRETQLIRKADGALGHSDAGPGYIVGEWSYGDHGECVRWDLNGPLVPERRRFLFQTWNLGHLSIRAGRCLRADETHLSMVSMSSGVQLPLLAHRMTVTDPDPNRAYDFQVQAPLDMTGRAFCYLSNEGRNRFDLFLGVLIL